MKLKLKLLKRYLYLHEGRKIEYRKDQVCHVEEKQAKDMVKKGIAECLDDTKAINSKDYENKAVVPDENKSEKKETKEVLPKPKAHKDIKVKSKGRGRPKRR